MWQCPPQHEVLAPSEQGSKVAGVGVSVSPTMCSASLFLFMGWRVPVLQRLSIDTMAQGSLMPGGGMKTQVYLTLCATTPRGELGGFPTAPQGWTSVLSIQPLLAWVWIVPLFVLWCLALPKGFTKALLSWSFWLRVGACGACFGLWNWHFHCANFLACKSRILKLKRKSRELTMVLLLSV